MQEQPESEVADGSLVAELGRVRQRGIADIDVDHGNKKYVQCPRLQRLASVYAWRNVLQIHGRIAEIRRLLWDGLTAWESRGNREDARFVRMLFFDPAHPDRHVKPEDALTSTVQAFGWKDKDRAFDDKRREVFKRFAQFLIDFAEAQPGKHEVRGEESDEDPEDPPPRDHRRLIVVTIVIALCVIAGSLVIDYTISHVYLGKQNPGGPGPSFRPSPRVESPTPSPSYVPGKTYEELSGRYGSGTAENPHKPSLTGKHVDAGQKVRVTCKVYAPTIPSISPDGYWYLIASKPWNNKWYTPAKNFMNGDKPGEEAKHNTDFKVPNCPESG